MVGCREARELGDALVSLTLVASHGAGLDAVGRLAKMYLGLGRLRGLQAEVQKFTYYVGSGSPIPSDMRFNFSFVLAGLGSFSNFFGAFGGNTIR